MDARRRFIRRVEGAHAVLSVVAVSAAAFLHTRPVWTGVLLGALLGGMNFRALALLAARFTRTDDNAGRSGAMGLIIAKMAAMMAAVGAVMLLAKPDVGGFLVGISAAPVSLVIVAAIARPTFDDASAAAAQPNPEVQP